VKKKTILTFTTLLLIFVLLTSLISAQAQDDRIRRAQIYLQSDDYREAANILEAIVREDAGNADVIYLLGIAYLGLDETEKAENQFRRVINIIPDFEDSMFR
jgi:Tfp pilus assembly protein PilF